MMRISCGWLRLAIVLGSGMLALATTAGAQDFRGAITGVIKDSPAASSPV